MRILTIKDFCYISDGNYSSKYPRSDEFVSVGIPFIRANNLVNGTVVADDMYYISPDKHAELRKGHLQEGDVLITTRGNIGQTAIVPEKFHDANINAQIVLLRVDRNIAIPQYLAYALHSESVEDQIRRSTTGTALKQLPVGKLENIKVKIHSYSEQQRIVTVMHQVDELIYARRKQLAKLDQLVKSRFIELFGSPIANEYGWPVATLGELCLKITDGEHQNPQFVDSGIPMVMANNVQDKGVVFDGCRYISAENYMKFSRKCCPEFGDVLLVSRGATIGRCCINSESTPFSLMGSVILIKNNKKRISSAYLVNWLKNEEIKPMIYTTSSASAQQAIYMKDLVVRKVAVPPMELQEQYTAFVEQTDKSKLAIQQSLDKLELLKKSLMQEYFG